jgi:hypothetical protein
MGERSESMQPRTYDSLSVIEKVQAILATVPDPVTEPFLMELAGLDSTALTKDDISQIKSTIAPYEKDGGYMAPELKESMQNVDWQSVQMQIALAAMPKRFLGRK